MTSQNAFATMSRDEFIHEMGRISAQGEDLSKTIKVALQELMGEMSAMIALGYVGDANEGNLTNFVKRTEEFFGEGTPMILSSIVQRLNHRIVDDPK